MKKIFLLLVMVIAFPSFLLGGTKEEIIRLQSDVLQLQDLIRLLQKGVDEKNGMIVSLLEQLNDQVAQSSVGFKELADASNDSKAQTASLAQLIHQVQEDVQVLSAKIDETNNRVASLHRRLEENQMKVQSLRSVEATSAEDVEPDRVYSATFNDYLMGNYSLAISGFQDFLVNYPDSEYADNAAYYLGDCYLNQDRHELAIQAFDQVINLYPKADKTPVAYFKKAQALQELQRLEQAIDTLQKLKKLFPTSQEAKLAEDELNRLGAT